MPDIKTTTLVCFVNEQVEVQRQVMSKTNRKIHPIVFMSIQRLIQFQTPATAGRLLTALAWKGEYRGRLRDPGEFNKMDEFRPVRTYSVFIRT